MLNTNEARTATIERATKETSVYVSVNLDGTGKADIKSGLDFIDHLITSFANHSMTDIEITASSKDGIIHHLVEDIAIALSKSLDRALANRSGITRFGSASVPMDESLANASIDLIKRQFHFIRLPLTRQSIEDIPSEDIEHFVRSLLQNLDACVHVSLCYGDNDHHKIEAMIKAFAVAFRIAASKDQRRIGLPSTKGVM